MSRHNRDVALRNLEQFINDRFDSGAYDWSIAMISDGAHLLLPLTSDKERIHGALAEIRDDAAGRAMRDTYQLENRTAPHRGCRGVRRVDAARASGGGKPQCADRTW